MNFTTQAEALFFQPDLPRVQVKRMALGLDEPPGVDKVEFKEEQGGEVSRELGVPFLDGMDEIHVDSAKFSLRAGTKPAEVSYKASNAATEPGVVISLDRPGRLRKVEISFTDPTNPPSTVRIVVRPATPKGSGFDFSPPIYATPDFPAPGAMFSRVLGGMAVQNVDKGKLLLLPPLLGSAWLIQIATAKDEDGAGKLAPLNIAPLVRRVVIDAVPDSPAVVLAAEDGEVPLWSHPGLLLPEAGFQEVSFLPLAQKYLSKRLKSASGNVVLTLPLKFRSKSVSAIEVTAKSLAATYRVKPLGTDPLNLRLDGGWAGLKLTAPAGVPPEGSSVDLIAKSLGREMNTGSPDPPRTPPGTGIRVNGSRAVAASMPFLPLDGKLPGSVLPLVSVRVFVAAAEDSEAALEIRGDAAGAPGSLLAAAAAKRLTKGFSGWLEFELAKPLLVSSGKAPLWPSLRVNRGEVLWFSFPAQANAIRVSTDKGKTWAEPAAPLGPAASMMVQLFHTLDDPLPAPLIRLAAADSVLTENLLASAVRKGPREHSRTGISLPAAVQQLLANASGKGRVSTEFQLFSRSVLDLTIQNAQISYNPFQPGGSGGGF